MEKTNRTVLLISIILFVLCSVNSLPITCGWEPPQLPPAPSTISNSTFVLKQVVMVMRHGDRTASSSGECWVNDTAFWNCTLTYSSIPNNDIHETAESCPTRLYRTKFMTGKEDYRGNCETGQLTTRGLQQQIDNGKMLRKYLVDSGFLSKSFTPREIFVRSDDEDRTIQSAQGLLLGFYPPNNGTTSEIIDIHTQDSDDDDMTPSSSICPLYGKYEDEFFDSSEYYDHYDSVLEPLFKALTPFVGYTVSSSNFDHLYDCLMVHKCHGFPVPVNDTLFVEVVKQYEWIYQAQYSYPNYTAVGQAGIGFLVGNILEWMKPVIKSVPAPGSRKFVLFSAHDTTVAPLLAAFGVWDGYWPPYASHVFFEIYENTANEQFYVRALKSNQPLAIKGCDAKTGICSWSSFYEVANNLVLKDPSQQCNSKSPTKILRN